MREFSQDFFTWAIIISFLQINVAIILVFIRFIKGPDLPDRVVAMDLLAIMGASFICVYSILANDSRYLDVAITITLIAFLSTVAAVTYIHQICAPK